MRFFDGDLVRIQPFLLVLIPEIYDAQKYEHHFVLNVNLKWDKYD